MQVTLTMNAEWWWKRANTWHFGRVGRFVYWTFAMTDWWKKADTVRRGKFRWKWELSISNITKRVIAMTFQSTGINPNRQTIDWCCLSERNHRLRSLQCTLLSFSIFFDVSFVDLLDIVRNLDKVQPAMTTRYFCYLSVRNSTHSSNSHCCRCCRWISWWELDEASWNCSKADRRECCNRTSTVHRCCQVSTSQRPTCTKPSLLLITLSEWRCCDWMSNRSGARSSSRPREFWAFPMSHNAIASCLSNTRNNQQLHLGQEGLWEAERVEGLAGEQQHEATTAVVASPSGSQHRQLQDIDQYFTSNRLSLVKLEGEQALLLLLLSLANQLQVKQYSQVVIGLWAAVGASGRYCNGHSQSVVGHSMPIGANRRVDW